jgi:hypothetical protein
MPNILTEASTVMCGHGGTVATAGFSKLQVNGSAVLLKTGIAGKSVSSTCGTPNDSNSGSKQCTSVAEVSSGEASKLKAGGQPVMLETLAGSTDGTVTGMPQKLLSGQAQQTKLSAV